MIGLVVFVVGTFLFFRPIIRFFDAPSLGDDPSQVLEKMGSPTLVYRAPGWPERSTQSHWYIARTGQHLLPKELPQIKEVRWYYQVGFLHTVFFLIDFEEGKVSEIYEGGT
jgi:hypothetical protein